MQHPTIPNRGDANLYRIEDNILITATGSENLTPTIKDPDELEKIIQAS